MRLDARQQDAEIVVRVDELRLDLERLAIGGFGFDRLPGRPQQHAQVVVRIGVARFKRDCPLVGGNRVVETVGGVADDAEVAVASPPALSRVSRLRRISAIAFVAASLLMGKHAGKVQHVRILGRDLVGALDRRARHRRALPFSASGPRAPAPRRS